MHVGFLIRVEAKDKETACSIYEDACNDPNLCMEDGEDGCWDYNYGPKEIYDPNDPEKENTWWSDGETGENETRIYNGITWEEFKEQGVSLHRLKFMFNGFIEDNEDWDPSITDAGSFVSYPGPAEGNGAWVFVVCGHI